jgi:hypothetical protein
LRSELYPNTQELWSKYRWVLAQTKTLDVYVGASAVVQSVGDIDTLPKTTPYLNMVELCKALPEETKELSKRNAEKRAHLSTEAAENEKKNQAALSRFEAAKQKARKDFSGTLAKEFDDIAAVLKSLPGSYNVQPHIDECGRLSRFCRKKDRHNNNWDTARGAIIVVLTVIVCIALIVVGFLTWRTMGRSIASKIGYGILMLVIAGIAGTVAYFVLVLVIGLIGGIFKRITAPRWHG